MAQIDTSSSGGKRKKGAQKKMAIHVDFTPMVDMNMLLITFFMLCTTMIQSRTMQIFLPSNDKNIKEEDKNEAKADEAITLILDTEYQDGSLLPAHDENGNTKHRIYYYEGMADEANSNVIGQKRASKGAVALSQFTTTEQGQQGIRQILRERHKDVMDEYDKLKEQWRNKEISKEVFEEKAKELATTEKFKHPVVVIKPTNLSSALWTSSTSTRSAATLSRCPHTRIPYCLRISRKQTPRSRLSTLPYASK